MTYIHLSVQVTQGLIDTKLTDACILTHAWATTFCKFNAEGSYPKHFSFTAHSQLIHGSFMMARVLNLFHSGVTTRTKWVFTQSVSDTTGFTTPPFQTFLSTVWDSQHRDNPETVTYLLLLIIHVFMPTCI